MQDYETLTLATGDGAWRLALALDYGGRIISLSHRGPDGQPVELIAGPVDGEAIARDRYFHGVVLYPFVNRLDGGSYYFNGRSYQFEINEPERNNSLHGFLWQIRPEVVTNFSREHEAEASLFYRNDGSHAGYPFPADIVITYRLSTESGLSVVFRVINQDEAHVPVGIGWHPYFTLGQPVDELSLHLPGVNRIKVDERRLPTGESQNFIVFQRPHLIGPARLDDCMALQQYAPLAEDMGGGMAGDPDERAGEGTSQRPDSSASTAGRHAADNTRVSLRLWSEQQQRGIECWQMSREFPYIHLFIPPGRDCIAIEPVSCGIDAFNSGENVVHLAPGEVFSARCGVNTIKAE